MLKIKKSRNLLLVGMSSFLVMATAAGGFIATQQIASAAPATINVTMFTHEDSHPDAGDGCSLYEASIAANTQAAYGGCDAGSVDGTTIVLGSGTYSSGAPLSMDIDIANTSVVGEGMDDTIVDGYNIDLSGDDTALFENLTVNHTESNSIYLNITGSNKTIRNVSLLRPITAQAFISLDTDEVGVSNITIENVVLETIAGSFVVCEGSCSDVNVTDLEVLSSSGSAQFTFDTANGTLINNIEVVSPSYSEISIGENANFNGGFLRSECGGNVFNTGAGSVINDFEQLANTGCGMSFNGEADTITNLRRHMGGSGGMNFGASVDSITGFTQTMNGQGSSTFTGSVRELINYEAEGGNWSFDNSYDGSTIENFTARPGSTGSSFNANAEIITNLTIDRSYSLTSTGVLSFTNTYDGAVIKDVLLKNARPEEGGNTAQINGSDVSLINFTIDSHADASALLSIDGANSNLQDIKVKGGRLVYSEAGDAVIENFSISDSIGGVVGPSITMPFDAGNVTIRNGVFSNVASGISVTEGQSLLVENVQMENIKTANSPGGAIYAIDVDEITITDVTLDNVIYAPMHGTISIFGGSEHSISNTTITDSTGGIALYQSGSPAMVTNINNVTVVNNANTADHQEADYTFALHAAMSDDNGVVNVTNSVIGGSSPYVECSDNTMPGTMLFLVDTVATHSSCEDFGATVTPSLAGVFASGIADNGSSNAPLGYNGEFGSLQTLALLPGENAVLLAGDSSTCEAVDARGVERPDGMCDLGAFQLSSVIQDGGEAPVDGGDDDDDTQGPGAPSTGVNGEGPLGLIVAILGLVSATAAAIILRRSNS